MSDDRTEELDDLIDEEDELLPWQKWTTVGELGDVLPIAAGSDRSFSWRPLNLMLRERIAQEMSKRQDKMSAAALFCFGLAMHLETLQGVELASLKLDAAALKIRQLPWSSVLYIMARRLIANRNGDDEIDVRNLRCPMCNHLHRRATVHLGDMRVRAQAFDMETLPEMDVEIEGDVYWPPEQKVEQVTLGIPLWDYMCGMSDADVGRTASSMKAFLRAAIVASGENRGELPETVIGQLEGDADLLLLDGNLLSGGLVPFIPLKCQKDPEHIIQIPFNWQDADFLDGSPTSRKSRRRARRRRRK